MDTSLEYATVKQLATLIEKGSLSPVELTEYYLDRIERLDQRLNSFMLITHERARAAAKAAETAIAGGNYLGPLHGIPFAVKDLVNVAGLPTTNGSILFKERVARNDATVFRKLLQAGIVLIGKTGQVEFAFGGYRCQPPLRHAVESVGCPGAAHSRWIQQRIERQRRRRPGAGRLGDRHRRFGALAGCLQRARRIETDLRAREHGRYRTPEPGPRFPRTDCAFSGRRRAFSASARGPGPGR